MATKYDLEDWIVDYLRKSGGSAPLVDICWGIWRAHERDLRASGDLLVTWGYDVRWAAQRLREKGTLRPVQVSPRGIWELAKR